MQEREPFREEAQEVVLAVANKVIEGFLTAKSSTDIYYLLHRHTHSDTETRKLLAKLFALFELIDTEGIDCRRAVSSQLSDYEDAVMVETALRSGMDCIVTRNKRDYKASPVPVYTPTEFLKLLPSEEE
jgi:predicted nucleic acid-binding protein